MRPNEHEPAGQAIPAAAFAVNGEAAGLQKENLFENRFWLQIFGDQMRILFVGLSPDETAEVDALRELIRQMDGLLERARQNLSGQQLAALNGEAFAAVQDMRKYVLHILIRQLTGKVGIVALPSFTNHIVNDTEAYLDILNEFMGGRMPRFNQAELNTGWLIDAYAYSFTIADNLSLHLFLFAAKEKGGKRKEYLLQQTF